MVVVNEEKCVGCGICTCFCPVDALSGWGLITVDQDECTECLECVEYCPVDALEVKNETN